MSNLMTPFVRTRPVDSTRVSAGGAGLAVYTAGHGQPGAATLVFLHAGVCDSRMWAGQFDTFGADQRVVAYDRRGFGATAAVDEHFSSVDDLWAVLDALAIDRAVLIGCSQGGRIALDATLARPQRVTALVLVAAAIGGAPERTTHDPRLDGFIEAYGNAADAEDIDAQNRIEARVWLDGPFSPEGRVGGAVRDLFLSMNGIVLGGSKLGSTDVPDTAYARLAEVSVPTLVVWGPLDVPSVVVNMKHAAATIPGARACELDGLAHLPSLEAPARFDAALAAFLHDAAVR
ncbi:MAG: alpha/beta fold hydrolase [Burkholderiaceae bacterium]